MSIIGTYMHALMLHVLSSFHVTIERLVSEAAGTFDSGEDDHNYAMLCPEARRGRKLFSDLSHMCM